MSPTHKLTTDNATPSAMRSLRTAGIVASVAAIGIVTIGVMQRARSSNERCEGGAFVSSHARSKIGSSGERCRRRRRRSSRRRGGRSSRQ